MRLQLRVCLLLGLFLPVPALAGPDASGTDLAAEADLHFQWGVEAYRKGQYRQALHHLMLSQRLAPNPSAIFNIARTYERMGEPAEAWRYYRMYVGLVDEGPAFERSQEALQKLRGELALVEITSDPEGAEVYLDRENLGLRGQTPLVLAVPPGEHTVLLDAAGHDRGESKVTAVLGETVTQTISLQAHASRLQLEGAPEGAQVWLGERLLGTVPGLIPVPAGPRELTVRAPGFDDATVRVDLAPDEVRTRMVELVPHEGTLEVTGVEPGAEVWVDGQSVGFVPLVVTVSEGQVQLTVHKDGFEADTRQLTITDGQVLSIHSRLRSAEEVVAASRVVQAIEDAPASVTLITDHEIEAFGYTTLYEALTGVRGVLPVYDHAYRSIGFRGFNRQGDYGNRVLLTLDGHTLNDDQAGASNFGSDFSADLSDVRTIEVVRGPGSALYGTNALFGVVNVITRGRDEPGYTARITGDEGSTLRGRFSWGGGDEDAGLWLSAGGAYRQGADWCYPELAGTQGYQTTDGCAERVDRAHTGSAALKGWVGDVEVQGWFNIRRQYYPDGAFGTVYADPNVYGEDQRGFTEVRWEPSFGSKVDFYARAWADYYGYNGQFVYGGDYAIDDSWRGLWFGAEPRVVARPLDWMTLTAGMEVRAAAIAQLHGEDDDGRYLDEDPRQNSVSGYALFDFHPVDWFRAHVGGRYDWFTLEDVGGAFNPRGTLIFKPTDDDTIKAIAGTAFRTPSPYEWFYNDDGVSQIRPGELQAEHILTSELEYTHRFGDVVLWTTGVYYNRITDLIDTVPVDEEVFRYANTDDIWHTLGMETEIRRTWRSGWMASAQYSYQRTRIEDLVDGEVPTNSPEHMAGLKVAMPIPVIEATVANKLTYGSPRLDRDGGWSEHMLLWDLTLTGDIPDLPVGWGFGVRNLLDWRYDMPVGFDVPSVRLQQPGRTFFARLDVDL